MPDDTTDKAGPGPADYFLPSTVGHNNHDISKSRSPSFSMGVRLPGLFCERNVNSPSPGPKYQVEYLTKYGKANFANSRANIRWDRPGSSVGGRSRTGSLERMKPKLSNSLSRNASLESQPNIRHHNTCQKGKNVKVGESKVMNNELRSFCKEFGDSPKFLNSRISSAKKNSGISPRYRTDMKHSRY